MVEKTNVGAAARPSRQHYLRFPLRSDGPVWTLQVVLSEVILDLMQPETSGSQPAGSHAVRGLYSLNDIYLRASPMAPVAVGLSRLFQIPGLSLPLLLELSYCAVLPFSL